MPGAAGDICAETRMMRGSQPREDLRKAKAERSAGAKAWRGPVPWQCEGSRVRAPERRPGP